MPAVILRPGFSTTIQDRGRFGHMASGFAPSGAMDMRAYVTGNLLVGNAPGDPSLEYCLVGPQIHFTTDAFIALTGADFEARIDGKVAKKDRALKVSSGSVLSFGRPRYGMYGYISIAGGGPKVPSELGSCSTSLRYGLGGWKGRALQAGDILPLRTEGLDYLPALGAKCLAGEDMYYGFADPAACQPASPAACQPADHAACKSAGKPASVTSTQFPLVIRTVPGQQEDMFVGEGLDTFYSQMYLVTSKSDRMGCRLQGPRVATASYGLGGERTLGSGSDIPSEGIPLGAVQVPASGQPIVMLADRQTTGGYAKIATVVSVDIPLLVQARPGRAVAFKKVYIEEAQALYREESERLARLARIFGTPSDSDETDRRAARLVGRVMDMACCGGPSSVPSRGPDPRDGDAYSDGDLWDAMVARRRG